MAKVSSKNTAAKMAYRRAQAKKKKAQGENGTTPAASVEGTPAPDTNKPASDDTAMEVDSVKPASTTDDADDVRVAIDEQARELYGGVFSRFLLNDEGQPTQQDGLDKPEVRFEEDDDGIQDEEEEAATVKKLSKKQRKMANKLSVAELKALVSKPEMVEWTDVDSPDPRLLVSIKSQRNVVPVPGHWSLKREYLSSKRGIEKPPFALPKFIVDTGITEMRDAILEKQDQQTLRQKQRERVQGKLGKLDIDYQKLYEAFFRFQTKPELTRYGEVYYEGKENEAKLKGRKPGQLSDELKEALGMPPGFPPPWLLNMQRFGPPPSYPALKIPGLNAPIPPGAQWGFQAGGWGKPPVDEQNRPLYGGDVFGVVQPTAQHQPVGEPVEKSLWGELAPPEEVEEEEEEEEEDEEEEDEEMQDGSAVSSGLETPSGYASTVPASEYGGIESVSGPIDVRKQKRSGTETEEPTERRSAGTVLREKNIRSQGFFGGERAYDISGAQNQNLPVLGQEEKKRKRQMGDVDVSVDVDQLVAEGKLTKEELQKQYESSRKEQANPWGSTIDQEDLSEMIASESRKRLKKDEERRARR